MLLMNQNRQWNLTQRQDSTTV